MIMNKELTQIIPSEVQLFQSLEQKENFLFLLGALLARVISLKKVAEVMQLEIDLPVNISESLRSEAEE